MIANKLNLLIQDNVSLRKLSKETGVNMSTLCRAMQNKYISIKTLCALADYFKVTTDYLLDRENNSDEWQYKRAIDYLEKAKTLLRGNQ